MHITEVTDTDQGAVALSFLLGAWICDRDYPVLLILVRGIEV